MASAAQVPGPTPLLDACRRGDLSLVQRLVAEDPRRVSAERNAKGNTALIIASWYGHLEIVTWLVTEAGADPRTERGCDGISAWLAACASNNLDVAQWLLREDGDCYRQRADNQAPAFLLACALGHLDVARWLHACGLRIEPERDADGADALFYASYLGHLDVVKWLMCEAGRHGRSDLTAAIATACQRGRFELVHCLIGQDGKSQQDAILYACEFGYMDAVRWLVQRYPRVAVERVYGFGRTPFMASCRKGHLDIAKWLATAEPTCVGMKSDAGDSALTFASRASQWAVCEWLIEEHELEPTAEDLAHVAVATAAARNARWRRRHSSHWLQAVVACGTGAADALRATVEPSPVLQLLHDGRLTACDDGEGRPLRYMSWYGGMVAAML